MPYAVVFTPEAEEDFSRIEEQDPQLASFVLDHVEKLAEAPTSVSAPGGGPLPPMQRYSFWGEGPRSRTHFHLFFQYGQDEQTLWLTGIGVVEH